MNGQIIGRDLVSIIFMNGQILGWGGGGASSLICFINGKIGALSSLFFMNGQIGASSPLFL